MAFRHTELSVTTSRSEVRRPRVAAQLATLGCARHVGPHGEWRLRTAARSVLRACDARCGAVGVRASAVVRRELFTHSPIRGAPPASRAGRPALPTSACDDVKTDVESNPHLQGSGSESTSILTQS